jgi:hypothetical protein
MNVEVFYEGGLLLWSVMFSQQIISQFCQPVSGEETVISSKIRHALLQ